MKLLKLILNLFTNTASTASPLQNGNETKERTSPAKCDDSGVFTYSDSGFGITLQNVSYIISWTDVERLVAYKADLITTDEICMNITFNNRRITITEETPGWHQFVKRIQSALPEINTGWEVLVLKSPFEYDLTTIYERTDRRMPAKSNFFSAIKCRDETIISDAFKSEGWIVRNSSAGNYKLENSWSDLVLENDDEGLLLHGLVAIHPDNMKAMQLIFGNFRCAYRLEFYDNDELVGQFKNGM